MHIDAQTNAPTQSIHSLLEGAVDYAGLFPPAALPLDKAAQNYSRYLSGAHAWMLGRFVISACHLPELAVILRASSYPGWRVSALIGSGWESDLEQVARFNGEAGGNYVVDSVEFAPGLHDKVDHLPGELSAYFELPLDVSAGCLREISPKGFRAKARTGGIKPEAVPSAESLAGFVVNCTAARIPFKATAGLHHPIRSLHALTYEPNAVRAEMHGFVNLLMAAAFALSGAPGGDVSEILAERDAFCFHFTAERASWRGRSLPASLLRETRSRSLISFGSCSFEEPFEDLASLGWL